VGTIHPQFLCLIFFDNPDMSNPPSQHPNSPLKESFSNCTQAEIKKALDILTKARARFMNKFPFYGTLTCGLKLVHNDTWCKTAATNGKLFYYNAKFINHHYETEGLLGVNFVFCHEIHHCAYNHFTRKGSRHPLLWNIACDYYINNELKEYEDSNKYGAKELLKVSKWCYCDVERFKGMHSEQIYDVLRNDKEFLKKLAEGSTGYMLVDEHPDFDDVFGEFFQTDKELADSQKQFQRRLIQAHAVSKGTKSSLPGHLQDLIDDLVEPKISWRELLSKVMTSLIKVNYSWMRPSKKGMYHDIILPGMLPGDMVDIVIAIDTSGSISQEQLRVFLSEMIGIMQMFDQVKIHIFCFDVKWYNPQVFTKNEMHHLKQYEFKGGSGTDFEVIFDYCKENLEKAPKELVVFTDGFCCGNWGDANYCPTTWIIHGDKHPNPPFGRFAVYDNE